MVPVCLNEISSVLSVNQRSIIYTGFLEKRERESIQTIQKRGWNSIQYFCLYVGNVKGVGPRVLHAPTTHVRGLYTL